MMGQLQKLKIGLGSKRIEISAERMGVFGKIFGLMFRTQNANSLLFEFNKRKPIIHSCFVFFDFLALWLDENNKIVDFSIVKPFSLHIAPKKDAKKLVEIPFNSKNTKIISYFLSNNTFPTRKRKI